MKIGIFGAPTDPEVKILKQRIINRGVECLVVDLSRFPRHLSLAFSRNAILADDFDLLELDAAYLRSSGGRRTDLMKFDERGNLLPIRFATDEEQKNARHQFTAYVERERILRAIQQSVLRVFEHTRPLVNPLGPNALHRLKPFLYHFLGRRGVPVPRFMAASAGEDLSGFAARNTAFGKQTVVKPLAGIFKTRLQTPEEWRTGSWKIRGSLYQEYVEGDTLRCYVLDNRLIAAAKILFRGTVDSSLSQTGIEVVDLPAQAEGCAITAAKTVQAQFCGIDIMRDRRTGRYHPIDCNFSPMFANFARLSRIDIAADLADYLIRLAGGSQAQRPIGVSLLEEAKELLTEDAEIRRKLGM